jgi:hypothetical protein
MTGAAVFTIARDEPKFLPLWINYYRRYFDESDIYVLDNGGCANMDAYGDTQVRELVNVVPVRNPVAFDHDWLCAVVAKFQHFLLKSYDSVLFTEVDEFVAAPADRDLRRFIDGNRMPFVRCTGINVVHESGEPALDWDAPILPQRGAGYLSRDYSKALLAREPVEWIHGFHQIKGHNPPPIREFLLIHLQRVDHDYCLERRKARQAWTFNERDRRLGLGFQHHIVDPKEFNAWFYTHTDRGETRIDLREYTKGVPL